MPKPETPEAIVLAHAAIHAANPGRSREAVTRGNARLSAAGYGPN